MRDYDRQRIGHIIQDAHTLPRKVQAIETIFAEYAEWLDSHTRPAFEYTRSLETAERYLEWTYRDGIWVCGDYTVHIKQVNLEDRGLILLSIRHMQDQMIRDWNTFLAIKNRFIGENKHAVEIYPPLAELRDTSNTYHMLEWPYPIGFSWYEHQEKV